LFPPFFCVFSSAYAAGCAFVVLFGVGVVAFDCWGWYWVLCVVVGAVVAVGGLLVGVVLWAVYSVVGY
jgi:hypothetical protein